MLLTNAALVSYDHEVLRLPTGKRKEYRDQVDRLVSELGKTIKGRNDIKITKVMKAGSFGKFTILKKRGADENLDHQGGSSCIPTQTGFDRTLAVSGLSAPKCS